MAEEKREKHYWVHRITGGENGWVISTPLLHKYGIMSTGWSFLSTPEYANDIKERGIDAINDAYANEEADFSPNRYCLLRFVKEMGKGDVVIIPEGGFFSIYKIADNDILTNAALPQEILDECNVSRTENQLFTENGEEIDLGFYRRVLPISTDIPRNIYASPGLRKHMRILRTNAQIKSASINNEIRASIAAFKNERPFEGEPLPKNEEYSRWVTTREHSWPYRIFKKSNDELMVMRMAQISAKGYTYHGLKADGAKWDSLAYNFLYTNNNQELTVKDWSNSFNKFENWSRLNQLMALSSSFESYISAIVKLVVKSDPGLLIEEPHAVDGLKNIKYNKDLDNVNIKDLVESCTKGDWNVRVNNLRKLLMKIPTSLESNIEALEKIRKLRNNLGHAFGRDIDTFQTYDLYKLPKMDTLSSGQFKRLQSIVQMIASDIDKQIMSNNVGNFQPLYYYHTRMQELDRFTTQKEKAIQLKKMLFTEANDSNYSATFCEWVISYYDSL